jgi:hypothetical protein
MKSLDSVATSNAQNKLTVSQLLGSFVELAYKKSSALALL